MGWNEYTVGFLLRTTWCPEPPWRLSSSRHLFNAAWLVWGEISFAVEWYLPFSLLAGAVAVYIPKDYKYIIFNFLRQKFDYPLHCLFQTVVWPHMSQLHHFNIHIIKDLFGSLYILVQSSSLAQSSNTFLWLLLV